MKSCRTADKNPRNLPIYLLFYLITFRDALSEDVILEHQITFEVDQGRITLKMAEIVFLKLLRP